MTIEQKAKAYDEALELAKDYFKANQRLGELEENDMLSDIFPELEESEDERIRKAIVATIHLYYGEPLEDEAKEMIAWLEKQGEFYTKRDVDNAYIEGMAFAKDELEKQGKQKGYTFKSIPRLLDMIEPSDKANAYCQKLIDALAKEGYDTDAKIVEGVLKGWNGEDVPMAVMDEQKPFDYENANIQQTDFAPKVDMPRYSIGDVLCDKSCTTLDKEAQPNFEIIDIRNGMYICDKCSFPISQQDEYELVAKKIEQKPTDKVKPKFKVGDWVVQENIGVYKVIEVCESWYEVIDGEDNHYSISFDNEYMCHLWDITKDAKDGDVLSDGTTIFIFKDLLSDGSVMSYCDYDTDSGESDAFCPLSVNLMCSKITPTTKEQRDILFQKMHEAGWEFDFDKKVLKKIEQEPTDNDMKELLHTEYEKGRADAIAEMQKPVDCIDCTNSKGCINCEDGNMKETLVQKPAWTEADEKIGKDLIDFCIKCNQGDTVVNSQDDFTRWATWLKSLKERYTWKPSDEQMEALEHFVRSIGESGYASPYENNTKLLYSLLEQLKKLKEE